jgi:hypothetical protein
MPAPARKTPRTTTTPAEAAAAEALNEGDVAVEFRGATFVIPDDIYSTPAVVMALASGQDHKILYHLLGDREADRWVRLCKPGESFRDAASEFFEAYGKASGQGNS